jgi:hypothetical protein
MTRRPRQIWHIFAKCGTLALARITGWTGALVTQATIVSIAYKVFDLTNSKTETGAGAPAPADVLFDVAQQDGSWPYDDGYNFRFLLPASCFPHGGHRYRAEFVFTPAGVDSQPFAIVEEMIAENLIGS